MTLDADNVQEPLDRSEVKCGKRAALSAKGSGLRPSIIMSTVADRVHLLLLGHIPI